MQRLHQYVTKLFSVRWCKFKVPLLFHFPRMFLSDLQRPQKALHAYDHRDILHLLTSSHHLHQVKQGLGGNVRLILSGAAPLSAHVEGFLKVVTCAHVLQGYGIPSWFPFKTFCSLLHLMFSVENQMTVLDRQSWRNELMKAILTCLFIAWRTCIDIPFSILMQVWQKPVLGLLSLYRMRFRCWEQ